MTETQHRRVTLNIRAPERADGYSPMTDDLWTWARFVGWPSAEATQYFMNTARRCDAAHRLFERVRKGIAELEVSAEDSNGGPAFRRLIHEIAGDAELAVIALNRGLDMVIRAHSNKFRTREKLPKQLSAKQGDLAYLRDRYEHLEQSDITRPDPRTQDELASIFLQRKITYLNKSTGETVSLDIDAETTRLFIQIREHLVATWKDLCHQTNQAWREEMRKLVANLGQMVGGEQ
jgi:hypothetical protein